MPDLKLPQLPVRKPVKLTISITQELHQALTDYAVLYATTYETKEPLVELIPAMLGLFLESDRAFSRARHPRRSRSRVVNR